MNRFSPVTPSKPPRKVLVMGIGNSLLQDDGVGVHVVDALRTDFRGDWLRLGFEPEIIDAGTVGLALLPTLEDADAVIVVDAAEIGLAPGALRLFRDGDIDRLLSGKQRTVHEVALADLFAAAALRGRSPARRALIAIQPASIDWGLYPTPAVAAAIPRACAAVWALLRAWQAPRRQQRKTACPERKIA
jgi:hydrogenase maturation protease